MVLYMCCLCVEKTFQTNCIPERIYELVKCLGAEKKNIVRSIGFGGILDIKLNHLPLGLTPFLVENIDVSLMVQKIGKFSYQLSVKYVQDVLMLPRNPSKPLPVSKVVRKTVNLVKLWE